MGKHKKVVTLISHNLCHNTARNKKIWFERKPFSVFFFLLPTKKKTTLEAKACCLSGTQLVYFGQVGRIWTKPEEKSLPFAAGHESRVSNLNLSVNPSKSRSSGVEGIERASSFSFCEQ